MQEFWTILTTNMTFTRLQNYTNMVVDAHELQTFQVEVVIPGMDFSYHVQTIMSV